MEQLLRDLEDAGRSEADEADEAAIQAPLETYGAANATLAVAAVSDYLWASAWPLATGMLLGTNLRNFGDAYRQLKVGQIGLPVLYTGVATASLATGQFLPGAVMSWMMRFWQRRSQDRLAAAHRRLLGELTARQPYAHLETGEGVEVSIPTDRLTAGDVVRVAAGERIPVDGRIVRGRANRRAKASWSLWPEPEGR